MAALLPVPKKDIQSPPPTVKVPPAGPELSEKTLERQGNRSVAILIFMRWLISAVWSRLGIAIRLAPGLLAGRADHRGAIRGSTVAL